MERAHYRRVTPPRFSRQKTKSTPPPQEREQYDDFPETSHFGETFIIQSIISGIILIFVLGIGFLNTPITLALRNGLDHALAGHVTVEELVDRARYFGENWLGRTPTPPAQTPARTEEATEPATDGETNPFPGLFFP